MLNINIQEFIKQVYHYLIEIINTDSFLKITTRNGNVVIMSEHKYNSFIQVLLDKNNKS